MEFEGGVDYLADERKSSNFDLEAMKITWAGGKHLYDAGDRMARLVASDPAFNKDDRIQLERRALLKNTLRKAAHAWKRINELRLTEEEASLLRFYVDEPAFTDLHWGMFIPAIKGQGTDEQQRKWLPLAYKMQIIGCYAQTELGHGSNVQGLETTATFDPEADEFVVHSPTLTSTKWWPGGLGKASTHALVYARLVVQADINFTSLHTAFYVECTISQRPVIILNGLGGLYQLHSPEVDTLDDGSLP